jgi:hypothetical protein
VKHAIWLVNSRAGSRYSARGIKMPSRDFRGILKMSLFHCSYFIKQLPNGFPSRIAWSMHLGCCSTFGKRKNTLACGSSIFTLSESLATSLVHGSHNPARKTIWYSFNTGCIKKVENFQTATKIKIPQQLWIQPSARWDPILRARDSSAWKIRKTLTFPAFVECSYKLTWEETEYVCVSCVHYQYMKIVWDE